MTESDFSSRKRSSAVIEKYRDTDALVAAAGDRLVGAITDAIDKRGQAHIVLTGGGTGVGLLKRRRVSFSPAPPGVAPPWTPRR